MTQSPIIDGLLYSNIVFDWLICYIATPTSVIAHLIGMGLLVSLLKQGAQLRAMIGLWAGLELLLYAHWLVIDHGLSAAVIVWSFIKLYEIITRARVEIKERAVFIVGENEINEVTRSAESLNFDLYMSEEQDGTRRINSDLLSVVFHNNSTRVTQGGSDDAIHIDDITDISKGCTAHRRSRLGTADIEVNRCLSLTLSHSQRCVVLIADDIYLRDRWVEFLTSCSGLTCADVRAAWLEKLRGCHGDDDVSRRRDVTLDEALEILSVAKRPFDRQYAIELFKNFSSSTPMLTSSTSNGTLKSRLSDSYRLTHEQFYAFFCFAVHRPEITEIFERVASHTSRSKVLSYSLFSDFIQSEQKEDVSSDLVKLWISQYEPVLTRLNLSQIGFTNYLLADEHSVFKRECCEVYQDMTHPLSHYYIATSHNTYLTKDQLKSKSSIESYISAFKRGCKCVELDIWDGTSNEPIVYHGHTLTSKILLKDVLYAIRDYAFCVSRYPVILSFENHCSVEQQRQVAQHLRSILGDMLYTRPVPEGERALPSPQELSGFILIKSKKLKLTSFESVDEVDEDDDDYYIEDDEVIESDLSINSDVINDVTSLQSNDVSNGSDTGSVKSNDVTNANDRVSLKKSDVSSCSDMTSLKSNGITNGNDITSLKTIGTINGSDVTSFKSNDVTNGGDVTSLKSENDEEEFGSSEAKKARKLSKLKMLIEISNNLRKNRNKDKDKEKNKTEKIAQELSDLIVYCQTVRFRSFEHSKAYGKHYEMMSLDEKRALRVYKDDAVSWLQYNERQLTRVYPSGSRIDSSNFDPVQMWNTGCQLVALNYQTAGLEMQINQAQFSDNGKCGYVLKPEYMRKEVITFDPRSHSNNPVTLSIMIISGYQIPYKNDKMMRSDRQLCVQVRVTGLESDCTTERTKYVKNSGLNPVWNEVIDLSLRSPDLSFLSFSVFTKEVFTAQYTIPYRCMQLGYRRVPLQNKFSEDLPTSHLIIHTSIKPL